MPAEADGGGVHVAHLNDLPHRRLDAFQHVRVGGAGTEMDVRLHDQIAVANITGEVG